MRPVAGETLPVTGAQQSGAAATGGERSGAAATGGPQSGAAATGGPQSGAAATGGPRSGALVTVLAVLVAVAVTLAAWLSGPPAIADRAAAPGFSLPPLLNSAKRISLSDYPNQPVILNFCSAWSPPCKVETKVLETFYRRQHGTVIIIGVDSLDSRTAGLRLLTRSGVRYPVAYDPAQAVGGLYGVPGIPTTYFLNSQHQIIRTNLGWLSILKLERAKLVMDASSATASR